MPHPADIVPTRTETVATPDGETLHVEHFAPVGAPRRLVVFVHGFSSYCALYRHLALALAAGGAHVLLFDCRGHGRSTGRRGWARAFKDFRDDLGRMVALGRAAAPDVPLLLGGHSHGGLVVLDHVVSDGARADGLVLAAPWLALALRVPPLKYWAGKLMGVLWPTLAFGNGLRGEDVSRNPEVIANFDKDPLIHHVATPGWFNGVEAAQARVLGATAQITGPVLVQVVGHDRITDTPASEAFAGKIGARLLRYEDLFHEIFLEPERERVIADIVSFAAPFGA